MQAIPNKSFAQDSVKVSLPQIEALYLQQNLQLLAQHYKIDIAKAQVIQAKLYSNPNFQFTGNIYNPELKKAFDMSNSTGEYAVNIQQVILLAGKRNKQVKLAQTNQAIEENSFFDLLRTLRFTLHSDFYKLGFLQNTIGAYGRQITYLESLTDAYQSLQSKGAVTLKDEVRIKSLLYTLKAEQASLQNQATDLESELQLLIRNNNACVVPVIDPLPNGDVLTGLTLSALLDTAYNNRYDLKLAQNTLLSGQQNYALQKAMAIPDLTLGASFDKRGSFVENAGFFNLGIDLPVFNRNQGNIKAARFAVDQNKILVQQQRNQVENDVRTAYTKALNTGNMLRTFDPGFRADNQRLLTAITENFQKKNISLLDFTDFYESYKENITRINDLQNEQMQALELLQFAVGKSIY